MHEDRKEATRWATWGVGAYVALIAVIGLVSAAVWGVSVLVSGPKGQGDAIRQNNSAENWTKAQATFEDLHAEYETTLVKIEERAALYAASPDDRTLRIEVSGLRSYCASVVADYNAEARKFLSEDWKAIDLPDSLDATRCNE